MYLMILDHLLESRMMLGGHTTGAQWQYYSIIISETSNFYSKLHSTKFSFTSWFGLEKMRNYSKPANWPCYEYSWYIFKGSTFQSDLFSKYFQNISNFWLIFHHFYFFLS